MSELFPILRPFGVELTRSHKSLEVKLNSGFSCGIFLLESQPSDYLDEWRDLLSDRIDRNLFNRVYVDPGCLEFPTQIFSNYKQMKKAWDHLEVITKPAQELCYNPKKAWGGGGHVNVGFNLFGKPKTSMTKKQKMYINLARIIVENPFLIWAYGDPGDNHGHVAFDVDLDVENHSEYWQRQSSSYRFARCIIHGTRETFIHQRSLTKRLIPELDSVVGPYRDAAVCYKQGCNTVNGPFKFSENRKKAVDPCRIEMRFFGTATSWEMQEAHIEMAQALMDFASRFEPEIDDPRANILKLRKSRRRTIGEFRAFVDKMGLDWSRHERFVENIETRFFYGPEFLN